MDNQKPHVKIKAPKEPKMESVTPKMETSEMSHDKETKHSIKFEGNAYPAALEKYLISLASGFTGNPLVITAGDKSLTLQPQGEIDIELKAKKKEDECSIVLKLSWLEPLPVVETPADTLTIESRKSH